MDTTFVRDRITQLRLQKDISEYKMSYDLGHSRGYINNISSGKTLPSMAEFFAICDYFHITPAQFFDSAVPDPEAVQKVTACMNRMTPGDRRLLLSFAERLVSP